MLWDNRPSDIPSDVTTSGDHAGDELTAGAEPGSGHTERARTVNSTGADKPRKARRGGAATLFAAAKKLWIPTIILIVVGAGGLTVSRLHGIFGSEKTPSYSDTRRDDQKPFNPKHLTYEVFGPPGTRAEISYFDGNGDPQRLKNVLLPWSVDFPMGSATAAGDLAAQGDTDSIGCRILVDGKVKTEKTARHEVSTFTFCLLKSE